MNQATKLPTLPETPLKIGPPLDVQGDSELGNPSIFRCYVMLVLGSVLGSHKDSMKPSSLPASAAGRLPTLKGFFSQKTHSTPTTLPETNSKRTWKWMVGIRSFPLGMAYFQGRTVSFGDGKSPVPHLWFFVAGWFIEYPWDKGWRWWWNEKGESSHADETSPCVVPIIHQETKASSIKLICSANFLWSWGPFQLICFRRKGTGPSIIPSLKKDIPGWQWRIHALKGMQCQPLIKSQPPICVIKGMPKESDQFW